MPANKPNQSNYKNRQRYSVDIKALYSDYIKPQKPQSPSKPVSKGIDDYRSEKSIFSKDKASMIDALKKQATLNGLIKPSDSLQESRCHAFYRIIGFPVYDGSEFYNPGYDGMFKDPSDNNKLISKSAKVQIAINCINDGIAGFTKFSGFREQYPQDMVKIFAQNTSINASVLALSAIKTRKFVAPVENIDGDPLSTDKSKQIYKRDLNGQVGIYQPPLNEYIDVDGNTPTNLSPTAMHIIAPFLVDPRYSESVNAEKQIAVPFVLNDAAFKMSDTVTVIPPLLEIIISNRLQLDTANTSGQLIDVKDYIANNPSIKNEALVNKILSGYKTTEQQQFLENINIMKSMIDELVKCQMEIDKVQKDYYWIPIPSASGPEGGVSVRPVFISKALAENSTFITKLDDEIIIAAIEKLSKQSAASLKYDSASRRAIFTSSATIFNPNVNDDCGDKPTANLKELNKKRDNAMKRAGEALQTIEMITGEFSGLGLCDILAVVASLYIISTPSLLGFLDKDAYVRMKYLLNLPDAVRTDNLQACLTELTNTVKDFYNLMDKLYLDAHQNNNLT